MASPAKTFEDLWVWQESRQLVCNVYADFSSGSAAGTDYGFRNQIQRAAISIMNNIAEGFERSSRADFSRFLDIAKASSGEVRSMYYAAQDLNYVLPEISAQRRAMAKRLSAGIASFQSHLRSP